MGADSKIQIDGSHCRAICDEIGERLRVIFLIAKRQRCRPDCRCLCCGLLRRILPDRHQSQRPSTTWFGSRSQARMCRRQYWQPDEAVLLLPLSQKAGARSFWHHV